MPLPALGAVAQFLASNGARAAAAKFGKKAVEAAKKELSDRDKTVSDMADKANVGCYTDAESSVYTQTAGHYA
jgi:hypothetical protein